MKTLKDKLIKKQKEYCGTFIEQEIQKKIYEDVKQAVLDFENILLYNLTYCEMRLKETKTKKDIIRYNKYLFKLDVYEYLYSYYKKIFGDFEK